MHPSITLKGIQINMGKPSFPVWVARSGAVTLHPDGRMDLHGDIDEDPAELVALYEALRALKTAVMVRGGPPITPVFQVRRIEIKDLGLLIEGEPALWADKDGDMFSGQILRHERSELSGMLPTWTRIRDALGRAIETLKMPEWTDMSPTPEDPMYGTMRARM